MKKLFLKSAVLSIAVLFLSFSVKAGDFNLNAINASDLEFSETADKGIMDWIKPEKPGPQKMKDWTIMVFMNAKNDLSESSMFGLVGKWAEKDLKEMKKVGTTGKVNIVVEYGKKGEGSKRMLIKKKNGFFSSGEVVYQKDPKADMGDYRRVIDFVKWAKKEFPSRKTMLVLWNHGLGWLDPDLDAMSAGTGTSSKGILFDDDTKNYVRTKELGEILRKAGYVDVFVMNACLMQMAEVAYEIKDYTGLIVASEETMLAYGFDYEKLLKFMNSETNVSNAGISDFFINWYKDFFREGVSVGPIDMPLDSVAATLSTLNPGELKHLPFYLNNFARAAMNNNETSAIRHAISKVIRFTSIDPKNDKEKVLSSYADLYDFADRFQEKAESDSAKKAAAELKKFIKNRLVLRSVGLNSDSVNGYDYSRVGGIAIETTRKIKKDISPQLGQLFETKYSDLSLSRDSLWDEFLNWSDKVWLN